MRVVLSNASTAWGGVHQVTEDLARGLVARGHEVVVFCRPDSRLESRMRPIVPCEAVLRGMDFHPLVLARCARALRRHRPDVVLALMKKDVRLTAPAARLLGIPAVVRHANDRPLRDGAYHRWLYGRLPAHQIVNSEATRRTLLASAPWLDPRRMTVVHNSIDLDRFRDAAPADLDLPAGALAVGFVGRFEGRKGLIELLAAWPSVAAAVPRAHLVLAGAGELEDEVARRARDLPRVRLLGLRTDVPAVLRALDLLLVPSRWEGFGMVALEGLAAGTPVIAARASSLPEIVRDGVDGVLVPPGDPAALAAASIALLGDDGARARLRTAGPARAAQFSPDRMIDAFEAVLRSASGAG